MTNKSKTFKRPLSYKVCVQKIYSFGGFLKFPTTEDF